MTLVKLKEMKTLIGRILPFAPKIKITFHWIRPRAEKTMRIFRERILLIKAIHKSHRVVGMILSCPKYPRLKIEMKT